MLKFDKTKNDVVTGFGLTEDQSENIISFIGSRDHQTVGEIIEEATKTLTDAEVAVILFYLGGHLVKNQVLQIVSTI